MQLRFADAALRNPDGSLDLSTVECLDPGLALLDRCGHRTRIG